MMLMVLPHLLISPKPLTEYKHLYVPDTAVDVFTIVPIPGVLSYKRMLCLLFSRLYTKHRHGHDEESTLALAGCRRGIEKGRFDAKNAHVHVQ